MRKFIKTHKLLVCYGILIILFICGTFIAIYLTNKKNNLKEDDYLFGVKEVKEYEEINYLSAIETGSLITKENEYTKEDIKIISTTYSGYKDENVLKKVNKDIEKIINNLADKIKSTAGQKIIRVDTYANFSNVLSINVVAYNYGNNVEESSQIMLRESYNINLSNGEILAFTDLFHDEFAARQYVIKATRETLNRRYGFCWDNPHGLGGCEQSKEIDYSKVEDDLLKIVNEFEKNKIKSFYFSNSEIVFETDTANLPYGFGTSIYAANQYVALHTKFLTKENLYTNKIKLYPMMIYNPQITEYNSTTLSIKSDQEENNLDLAKIKFDEFIKKYGNKSKLVTHYWFNLNQPDQNYKIYQPNAYIEIWVTDGSLEKLKNVYIKSHTVPYYYTLIYGGGIMSDTVSDDLKEIDNSINITYEYDNWEGPLLNKNYEELKTLDDIFEKSFNYKEYFIENLFNGTQITEEQMEKAWNNIVTKISTNQVCINLEFQEEIGLGFTNSCFLYSMFNKKDLKI